MIGRSRRTPAAPTGTRMVSAASGPYAADERPSRPIAGTPAAMPIFSCDASRLASGRPSNKARMSIISGNGWGERYVPKPKANLRLGLVRGTGTGSRLLLGRLPCWRRRRERQQGDAAHHRENRAVEKDGLMAEPVPQHSGHDAGDELHQTDRRAVPAYGAGAKT